VSRACFSGAPVHPFGWPSERWSSCMPSAACSMCSALLGGELGAHGRRTSRSPRRTSSCSGRNSCEGASDRADSRSLATRNESACIDVPLRLRLSIYLILGHALLLLGVLGALLLVQLKTPHFASSYPPAAGTRSSQPRISPCRWTPCPGPPDPCAASLHRPAGPAAQHYVQNEQTGGTEVDRQGFRKEKCREALVPVVQYQPHFISLPSTTYPKA